jgi:hypothetical protein
MISEKIQTTKTYIARALVEYAIARSGSGASLVGQFMDVEGAMHPQRGVYGMSAWCVLEASLQSDLTGTDAD